MSDRHPPPLPPAEYRPFKSLIIHGVSEVGLPPTMTNARLVRPDSRTRPIAFRIWSGGRRGVRVSQTPSTPTTLTARARPRWQLKKILFPKWRARIEVERR